MVRIFYGWVIVLVAAIGLLFSFLPLVGFTFSVFLKSLAEEFGWSRVEIATAYSLVSLVTAICSPVIGRLVDHWGARRTILLCASLFGSALMSLSLLTPHLWHFYAVFLVFGVVGGGTSSLPYVRVISNWFDRRRGLALGLSMVGLGIGTFIMPSLVHLMISRWGWRTTYAILGSFPIFIVVPIVGLLLKERPEEMGLSPDGVGNKWDFQFSSGLSSSSGVILGISPSEALRTQTFWIIAIAFFLMSTCAFGVMIHLIPMLSDRGLSTEQAAWALSVLGIGQFIGRISGGALMDRLFGPYVAASFFSLAGVGVLLLWLDSGNNITTIATSLIGLALGAEVDMLAYLVSRYFGLRSFGEIFGYCFSLFLIGGVVGPFLMGMSFERIGSYKEILMFFFLMVLMSAGLLTRLGAYRFGPIGSHTH